MSKSDIFDFTLALVGAGNMGGAMLGGWLAQGMTPDNITIVDPSPSPATAELIGQTGIRHEAAAPGDLIAGVLVLAVKPQMMDKVLPDVAQLVGPETVVVSIAAGTSIENLAIGLGVENPSIVRAMPNTPALVRRGITVACPNRFVTQDQRDRVDALMRANGSLEWVTEEALIDCVTAVSGSGPAYVFYLAECMAEAGVKIGLPRELAMKLARETVSGAGELLARSPESPAKLRQNVTSPKGTTAAALDILTAEDAMADLMARAIAAAKKRAQELSG